MGYYFPDEEVCSCLCWMQLAHFQPSWSLWTAAQSSSVPTAPFSWGSPPHLLNVHSVPLARCLIATFNNDSLRINALAILLSNWSPIAVNTFDQNTSCPAVQVNFYPPYCPLIEFLSHQCDCEDTIRNAAKGFTKVNVNNIHCSTLMHWTSHLITEGRKAGQAWFALVHSYWLSATLTWLSMHWNWPSSFTKEDRTAFLGLFVLTRSKPPATANTQGSLMGACQNMVSKNYQPLFLLHLHVWLKCSRLWCLTDNLAPSFQVTTPVLLCKAEKLPSIDRCQKFPASQSQSLVWL